MYKVFQSSQLSPLSKGSTNLPGQESQNHLVFFPFLHSLSIILPQFFFQTSCRFVFSSPFPLISSHKVYIKSQLYSFINPSLYLLLFATSSLPKNTTFTSLISCSRTSNGSLVPSPSGPNTCLGFNHLHNPSPFHLSFQFLLFSKPSPPSSNEAKALNSDQSDHFFFCALLLCSCFPLEILLPISHLNLMQFQKLCLKTLALFSLSSIQISTKFSSNFSTPFASSNNCKLPRDQVVWETSPIFYASPLSLKSILKRLTQ